MNTRRAPFPFIPPRSLYIPGILDKQKAAAKIETAPEGLERCDRSSSHRALIGPEETPPTWRIHDHPNTKSPAVRLARVTLCKVMVSPPPRSMTTAPPTCVDAAITSAKELSAAP